MNYILSISLLAAVTVCGSVCAEDAQKATISSSVSDDVVLVEFSVEKPKYPPGLPIDATLKVTNVSGKSISYYSVVPGVDMSLAANRNGKVAPLTAYGAMYSQAPSRRVLENLAPKQTVVLKENVARWIDCSIDGFYKVNANFKYFYMEAPQKTIVAKADPITVEVVPSDSQILPLPQPK